MEGGTTSREGKEQAFAFFFCQLRPDCGRLFADAVALCLRLGEGIVKSWYGVKENTLFEG